MYSRDEDGVLRSRLIGSSARAASWMEWWRPRSLPPVCQAFITHVDRVIYLVSSTPATRPREQAVLADDRGVMPASPLNTPIGPLLRVVFEVRLSEARLATKAAESTSTSLFWRCS
jgi:hypothetical protein